MPIIVNQGFFFMITNILIIGGSSQGNELAKELQKRKILYTISYAGRIKVNNSIVFNKRVGGFGGVLKMARWLKDNKISHVIDASHPFAKRISYNTYLACNKNNLPLVRYTRKSWIITNKDNWKTVSSYSEAANCLADVKQNVFLAIGKLNIGYFYLFSKHFYLLRMAEKTDKEILFPNYHCVIERGPFKTKDDISLLRKFKIDIIVAKNSGGSGSFSKIKAAQLLNIPIIMIDRPKLPQVKEFFSILNILKWLNLIT